VQIGAQMSEQGKSRILLILRTFYDNYFMPMKSLKVRPVHYYLLIFGNNFALQTL
jgi:hypothetical protein